MTLYEFLKVFPINTKVILRKTKGVTLAHNGEIGLIPAQYILEPYVVTDACPGNDGTFRIYIEKKGGQNG